MLKLLHDLPAATFQKHLLKGFPAMRIWFKILKDNHLIKDTVIENHDDDTRTHKIFQALDAVCYEFDLGKPIWLDANIREFQKISKTRFTQDNFIEAIEFDYLEIHIIEEGP